MVLKSAPKVLLAHCAQIGSPEEYFKNKAKNYFPEYDCKIPNQRDSLDEDDLDAALCGMRLSDVEDNVVVKKTPMYEEAKGAGFKAGSRIVEETTRGGPVRQRPSDAEMYMPVKALNQFSADWRIKVRVVKKYDMKKWNNPKG